MRRFLRNVLLVIVISLCICACDVVDLWDGDKSLVDYDQNADIFKLNANNELELKEGVEVPKEVVIPLKLKVDGEDVTVTAWKDGMFTGCETLETVRLNGMVESVENGFFNGCTNLKAIIMDDGFKCLDYNAIVDCYNLELIESDSLSEDIEVDISNLFYSEVSIKGKIKIVGQEML